MNKTFTTFVFLGLATLPIYLGPSGGVQIAHIMLFFGGLISLTRRGLQIDSIELLLIVLASLVVCRELVAIMSGAPLSAMMPALYLLFNCFIFSYIRRSYSTLSFSRVLTRGLFVAMCIALIELFRTGVSFYVDTGVRRASASFNNPNQLGYFAVCLYSCAAIFFQRTHARTFIFVAFTIGALLLATASLSKAATVSLFVSLIFLGTLMAGNKWKYVIAPFIASFLTAVVYNFLESGKLDSLSLISRLRSIGSDSDDSLAARGYGLILEGNFLEQVLGFGSTRAMRLIGHEVHSTFGSVLICYGFLGASIFLIFLWTWVVRLWKEFGGLGAFVVAGPPLLYGITHNGIRFTIFWLLLAISFSQFKDFKNS